MESLRCNDLTTFEEVFKIARIPPGAQYRYQVELENKGFDSPFALLHLREEDMLEMGFKVGHARSLSTICKGIRFQEETSESENDASGN